MLNRLPVRVTGCLTRRSLLLLLAVAAILAVLVASSESEVRAVPLGVQEIILGGDPTGVGVDPSTDRTYVSNVDRDLEGNQDFVHVIHGEVLETSFDPDNSPEMGYDNWGIEVNAATNRVYVAVEMAAAVGVTERDPELATYTFQKLVPMGGWVYDLAFNPGTSYIYVAVPRGPWVEVIDGESDAAIDRIQLSAGSGPLGVALNPETKLVYVARYGDGKVSVIDGDPQHIETLHTEIAVVNVGGEPIGVAVNSETNRIYVSDKQGNQVFVIDGADQSLLATVPVGSVGSVLGIEVDPAANCIYVVNSGDATVSVIDGASNQVVSTIPVGTAPLDVGVNPETRRIYVSNRGDGTVWIFEDSDFDCIVDSEEDDDADGFSNFEEQFIGTDPADDCPDDPSDDAWPPDMNNDTSVNILDVLMYKPQFEEGAPYDSRYDLNTDGSVNILDVVLLKPYLGMSCTL